MKTTPFIPSLYFYSPPPLPSPSSSVPSLPYSLSWEPSLFSSGLINVRKMARLGAPLLLFFSLSSSSFSFSSSSSSTPPTATATTPLQLALLSPPGMGGEEEVERWGKRVDGGVEGDLEGVVGELLQREGELMEEVREGKELRERVRELEEGEEWWWKERREMEGRILEAVEERDLWIKKLERQLRGVEREREREKRDREREREREREERKEREERREERRERERDREREKERGRSATEVGGGKGGGKKRRECRNCGVVGSGARKCVTCEVGCCF